MTLTSRRPRSSSADDRSGPSIDPASSPKKPRVNIAQPAPLPFKSLSKTTNTGTSSNKGQSPPPATHPDATITPLERSPEEPLPSPSGRTKYPRLVVHKSTDPELPEQYEIAAFLFREQINGAGTAASTKRGFTNTLPSSIEKLDSSLFHFAIVVQLDKVGNSADYVIECYPILSYSSASAARDKFDSAIPYVQKFEETTLRRHLPLPFKEKDGTTSRAPTPSEFGSSALDTGTFVDEVPSWVLCKKQMVLLKPRKSAWHRFDAADRYTLPHETIARIQAYERKMDMLDFAQGVTGPEIDDNEFDDEETQIIKNLDSNSRELLDELLLGGVYENAHSLLKEAIAARNTYIHEWFEKFG